jgi:hypothetical protein
MPRSVITDPLIARFVEDVAAGANAAADSVAGLVLRLVGRVTTLEQRLETQDGKIAKIDKLARQQPKLPRSLPPVRLETGIDMDGNPVRIEHRIKRPRGRPKGARDRYQRQTRRPGIVPPAPSSHLLDSGWDDLG